MARLLCALCFGHLFVHAQAQDLQPAGESREQVLVWLGVSGLMAPGQAVKGGWFTFSTRDSTLEYQSDLVQARNLAVSRHGGISVACKNSFVGQGYETTLLVYRQQRLQQTVSFASTSASIALALSDNGNDLAVAFQPFNTFELGNAIQLNQRWNGALIVLRNDDATGKFKIELARQWPNNVVFGKDEIGSLRWGPGEQFLAFEHNRDLYKADLNLNVIKLGQGRGACYSPQGSRLAIVDWSGNLQVKSPDGELVLKKALSVHSGGMAWLDEQTIALTVRELPAWEKQQARFCIVDIDSGEVHKTEVIAHHMSVIGVTLDH